MGLASRHRWDERAVEYFRVMKLDGEAKAEAYRSTFNKTNEFDKALERVMARVVKYSKENNHASIGESASRRGQSNGGEANGNGPEAPVEHAEPTTV